ncbi:DNA primase [[Mycoplasma] falconis]|uniref:DNA primase n=1 Tax=[Mycoplasma] falconis TaxID=92403 RepID=A0A501X9W8_9BACT|nr:DNA primase [[Mycoplasma] falconis]TPE57276.1 DNA primase [[Mycoplasma] falconis]
MEENVWELVLSKMDIISVIAESLPLIKQGKNFKACCPFHGEKTPSFVVSPEKQIFKCFGCGKSGNAIKFVELQKSLTAIDALKYIANKFNIDISQYEKRLSPKQDSQEHLDIYEVNKTALDLFEYELLVKIKNNKDLQSFVIKRKLNKELIKAFKIGFADKETNLYKFLKGKNLNEFAIANASLITTNQKNFFNNRVIFPIQDKNGNIVAFSGRSLNSEDTPKYLNSAETSVFVKNEVLFNFYNAKAEINNLKEVYLVEGQFDVIAMYKAGYKNTVAAMGTSLSKQHLELLKNCQINLFFDNDKAGKLATQKNLRQILYWSKQLNIKPYFIINKADKDADELYNLDEGKTLKNIVENKIDIVAYLLNNFVEVKNSNLNDTEKINQYQFLFEYVYYLETDLQLVLKNKLLENKIFNAEICDELFKNYVKPNFPSSNFKVNKEKAKSSLNYVNDYPIDLNTIEPSFIEEDYQININHFPKPKNNKYKKNNPPLIGRARIIALLIKTTLQQPQFVKNWKIENFSRINYYGSQSQLKNLICYLVKLIKDQNLTDKQDWIKYIENDHKLSNNIKQEYLQLIAQINDIAETSYNKDQYDQQINKLNDSLTTKKLFTKRKV